MGRLFLRLVINAVALWVTVLILDPHVTVVPYGDVSADWNLETVLTYLLLAIVFGLVNGIIGGVVRVIAFPIYILTLGLVSLLVNGALFLLVAWISSLAGFGLLVEPTGTGFWWGVLGALLLGIISWVIGIVLRPFTARSDRR